MIASRPLTMVDAERPLVLVIEDDSDLRRICLDMLGARGYRTLGAASVGDGLRAFGERQPAVRSEPDMTHANAANRPDRVNG